MNDSKPWYQSKTIFVDAIISMMALLSGFGVPVISDYTVEALVGGIVAGINIILRFTTSKRLTK